MVDCIHPIEGGRVTHNFTTELRKNSQLKYGFELVAPEKTNGLLYNSLTAEEQQ